MDKGKVWRKFEDHLLNIQVTKNRQLKLKNMFEVVTRVLDLEKAKRKEIEEFLNKLNRDEFLTKKGKKYSGSTKSDIKKFLKQYYKHTRGKDEFYPPEVAWIKTKIAKDEQPEEKPIITQEQAIKLANQFNKPEFRILTLILFDSGYRIEEALSCLKKDLTFDVFDESTGNKCWWLKCNVSKTETRNIPLQLFTEDINNFVNSSYYRDLKDEDTLFNFSYASYLSSLKYASQKIIGKKLSPHCLRHSSATLYSKLYEGNMIAIANRYGWSYSSRELKTYIRKSKATHMLGAKKVFSSELLKIKEDNQRLNERVERLEKLIKEKLVKEIDSKKNYKR